MDIQLLISQIKEANSFFKVHTSKSIDKFLTCRNWIIGGYIFHYEQNGEDKAEYGSKIEENLAAKIDIKGLSSRNLKLFKQFYLAYPQIVQTVSALLENSEQKLVQTASALLEHPEKQRSQKNSNESQTTPEIPVLSAEKLINNLSFSHFVELVKIDDPLKRTFYEIECIKGNWSVRELNRQIKSLIFERSAAAENPEKMLQSAVDPANQLLPVQLVKTPYVFDFLGLPDEILGSESDVENALINDLKSFMLELGHGFCFEAQQKRIVIGGEYYFVDLVFYHRILKCHVIIELKIAEFNHENAGQLNTYIQYYKENIKEETDNDPIGILLCTGQNEELVKYALGGMDENLFVSEYQTALPSTEKLEEFLKQEKDKLE